MKFNVCAAALTVATIWGVAVLGMGLANLAWPAYGLEFLRLVGSIYPGYHAGGGPGSVAVGTLWAVGDGLVDGAIVAWLYNRFASTATRTPTAG